MATAVQQTALRGLLATTIASERVQQDTRFAFGTEASEFSKPPVSAYAAVWKPLPLSAAQQDTHGLATHMVSRSAIFPRLQTSTEEVKNKLVPHANELLDALKAQDDKGVGLISHEHLKQAVKATGVFLTAGELDQLIAVAPHEPPGSSNINYVGLVDVLLGKSTLTSTAGLSTLPQSVEWPADQGFEVSLRLRSCAPFTVPGWRMVEFAKLATKLCRTEADAEKVHGMLRTHMLRALVTGQPQPPLGKADLGFTQWLSQNSVFSLTAKSQPGPIPPEVYDVLDSIIYDGLGIPRVVSATQTLTSLSTSLRRPIY